MKAFKSFVAVFILCIGFVVLFSSVRAYYACGGGPCNGSYPCNGGLSCNGVCGVYYNTCGGATCNANGGFDSSSCSTGNQCTPAGTTRTASLSACSATCGSGTQTCNCGAQNNCTVTCSGGKACGDNTTVCCVDQAPQTKPVVSSCAQMNTSITAKVDWTFSDTGSTCGQSWGYKCAGNSNSFQLRFSGGKGNENALSTDRTLTTGNFPDWGTYTVQVCALNGAGENCSAAANCVLTAPTCSVSGNPPGSAMQSPTSGCTKTEPNLTSTFGYGANEMNFLVKTSSDLSSAPYSATSGWSALSSYTPTLATGTYYWNAISRSTAVPVTCNTASPYPTGYPFGVDKNPPTVPSGNFFSVAPDGTCLNKYFVTYQWGASTDIGCGSSNIIYQSDIATDVAHNSVITTNSTGARQITTTGSYPGNTVLYGRAQAVDGANNPSGWSADAGTAFPLPTPTLYPTIFISGNFKEKSNVCADMTIDPNNLNLSISANPGVTPVCQKQTTSYSCNITIDNQNTLCVTYPQTVTVNAVYSGYGSVVWGDNNTCANNTASTTINAPGTISKDLDFIYNTAQGWFKTSTTSFTNRTSRNNIIPNNVTAYDSDDDTSRHIIAKEAGAVLNSSTLTLGANTVVGGQTEYSSNNWSVPSYVPNSIFTPSKFTDYMKSRKQYKTITQISDIPDTAADGIYFINSDLGITTNADILKLNGKNILLVADNGTHTNTVTLNKDISTATSYTSGSLGILANNIVISGSVTEVDAILIGNTVNIGTSSTKLKINGNLIQLTSISAFNNTRTTSSPQSPSFFIKFNQNTYLNLLPYLSISMYDWRQLQ